MKSTDLRTDRRYLYSTTKRPQVHRHLDVACVQIIGEPAGGNVKIRGIAAPGASGAGVLPNGRPATYVTGWSVRTSHLLGEWSELWPVLLAEHNAYMDGERAEREARDAANARLDDLLERARKLGLPERIDAHGHGPFWWSKWNPTGSVSIGADQLAALVELAEVGAAWKR